MKQNLSIEHNQALERKFRDSTYKYEGSQRDERKYIRVQFSLYL